MNEFFEFLTQPLAMLPAYAHAMCGAIRSGEECGEFNPPAAYCVDRGEAVSIEAASGSGSRGQLTAVVPLFGPLSTHGNRWSTSTAAFVDLLQKMDRSDQVGNIVVHINSPGGTVTGTMEAAAAVRGLRDSGSTKITSVVNPMMASAATWIGTAAHEVAITPSGQAGSIGVISMYLDMSGAAEQAGMKMHVARVPEMKARFTGWEPLTDEMAASMQDGIAEAYEAFVASVADNRGTTPGRASSDFGKGEMMSSANAMKAGLVDRIATLQQVLDGIELNNAAESGRRRRMHALSGSKLS